ncbi:MAG TPA: dTDP-4-dehydrorhamnose 3,5-epimerase [Candidatus Angelobacter sp.]|nr:dTDP-4-dehydrorhamnose 3,5-epimerase [Candidatus Angelobacter sp.]
MNIIKTLLKDVLLLEPRVFRDDRGFFLESYNRNVLASFGIDDEFVQDNHSCSVKNVLRGLHYQIEQPQGKLVRVVVGEVLDVVVDLRRSSPTFGQWESFRLSAANQWLLWVPPGFAHGFYVKSESAHFIYKTTEYYRPEFERTIAWNDPDLKIDWQLQGEPALSAKDRQGLAFRSAPMFDDVPALAGAASAR